MENLEKLQLGIVGQGFVGKAVDYGFTGSNVNKCIIDPNLNTTIDNDLVPFDPMVVFVAVPTPMKDDGSIDASIVKSVCEELFTKTRATVVIKSTVTPDILSNIKESSKNEFSHSRLVYNPEFLTEAKANEDFVTPHAHVFGGDIEACLFMHEVYEKFSLCQVAPVFNMSLEEASLVKYGINSYLAAKVLWFNEFYDVVQKNGSNYRSVINALSNDPRIGNSHTQVPGFDGRRGFGGACFPKDTKALAAYSGGTMKTLAAVIEKNNTYREAYELDAREKEQNVNFN